MTLALVRDMRELREPSSVNEVADFETDARAGAPLTRITVMAYPSSTRRPGSAAHR